MERLNNSKVLPEIDYGIGFGYRVDTFFIKESRLAKIIPECLRQEYVSTQGGGLTRSDANKLLEEVQKSLPNPETRVGGVYKAKIVEENPYEETQPYE